MTQCRGVRCCTDQVTFKSVDIVSSHYRQSTYRAAMLPLEYWTHFKTFLCTSTYTWHRRKIVSIANDSMVRQYPIDHRRSWVRRPSWGWRASSGSNGKDGCVCAWWLDVQIEYITIKMYRNITYTPKTMSIFNSTSTSMRRPNVTVWSVERIQ